MVKQDGRVVPLAGSLFDPHADRGESVTFGAETASANRASARVARALSDPDSRAPSAA